MSCQRDQANGANAACRGTFLRQWLPNYRFIIGGTAHAADELAVPALDDYGSLQFKQRAAYAWAFDAGCEHVFVAFTDTYIHVPRLAHCGFEQHDYMGLRCKHGEDHLSGGNGYWLSRKAMGVILDADPIPHVQGDQADYFLLRRAGIAGVDDHRFGDTITRHLSTATGVYDPAWMYDTHKEMTRE